MSEKTFAYDPDEIVEVRIMGSERITYKRHMKMTRAELEKLSTQSDEHIVSDYLSPDFIWDVSDWEIDEFEEVDDK